MSTSGNRANLRRPSRSLLCYLSQSRLSSSLAANPKEVDRGLFARLAATHSTACDRCQQFVVKLNALEQALAEERLADAACIGNPPGRLRVQVIGAYHRSFQEEPAIAAPRRGRLERLTLAVGSVAVVALVAVIGWSRRADFGPPPRTVRIDLPADSTWIAPPTILIRRASGHEEVQ